MYVNNVKNRPIIYGLTGGIATGKSTASNYFRKQNIKVFDSDNAVSEIWKDKKLINAIKLEYNIDLTKENGKKDLAKLMFNEANIKKHIESLIHPLVYKRIDEWINLNKKELLLIIDMPLLFEVGYNIKVDKTILIYANKKLQLQRLMKRDNLDKKSALLRINSQINIEDKKKLANIIIDNTKDIKHLEKQLLKLTEEIKDEN